MRPLAAAAGLVLTAGSGTAAYAGVVERRRYTLRQAEAALAGLREPLRVLHIADIHYVPGQRKAFRWLQGLAELQPDLVINTGDNLSHPDAIPEVLEALAPLRALPGAFVPGSNDYYAPRAKNPLKYLAGPSRPHQEHGEPTLDTARLHAGFESSGWANLTNAHAALTVGANRLQLAGTDDAHIERDAFDGWGSGEGARLAVTHAPVRSVLAEFARADAGIVLAGHTHGGQVCLPGGRALVTNCDLPTPQAKGLTRIDRTGAPSPSGDTLLHVSAGIGTSATAPVRLFCPPEATLLTLLPAPDPAGAAA
ncbi:metallophosphoesterase [Nesterenkonia populi]|uniref:metallophosphoesterase n=1 Tax=Nesterenkonia populi TaxID=1591087 RepID=UPI0011BEF499|nr:metallophosphoesterase [Nesterenkonia populi]